MANDPTYDAAVSLAKEHLTQAFETMRFSDGVARIAVDEEIGVPAAEHR
jgi:hypothetical protein